MNIQIFGRSKSFDTKKAMHFFSDRRIKVQYIDLKEKPMSRGEFDIVKRAVGDIGVLLDCDCRDKTLLSLWRHLPENEQEEKMFEYQTLMRAPIVRNGRTATVGYQPDIWKEWE